MYKTSSLLGGGCLLLLSTMSITTSSFLPPSATALRTTGFPRHACGIIGAGRWRGSQRSGAFNHHNGKREVASHVSLLATKGGGGDPRGLWYNYLDALETRPVQTKSWSNAVIAATGDILSQYVSWQNKGQLIGTAFSLDIQRLATFSLTGALVAPALHWWFGQLNSLVIRPDVEARLPRKWGAPALQLLLDQTVGAAVFNSAFLFTVWFFQGALSGGLFPLGPLLRSVTSKLKAEFWPTLVANWKLWPIANGINFTFVPPKLRVLFVNVVGVAWSMYMSGRAASH